jgi:hypothetical protein
MVHSQANDGEGDDGSEHSGRGVIYIYIYILGLLLSEKHIARTVTFN